MNNRFFYRATLCAVFAVAQCLIRPSVRLSVTLVYCIQTAEDIVKLLCRPGSPNSRVFDIRHQYPIPRRTPSAGPKIHGGVKIL